VGALRMEGQTFGDVPLNMEIKLEVWDSPNRPGVIEPFACQAGEGQRGFGQHQ